MFPGAVVQSVLAPASRQSASIQHLWQVMLWVSVAIFLITMAFVGIALARGVGILPAAPSKGDRNLERGVAVAIGATVVILFGLLVAAIWTSRAIASLRASSAVTIEVTGHQWWWEITYVDASPDRRAVTANEIHIPLNRPVVLKVTSRDVIHSFWAPNLHGKRDLIPGYITAIWLQADRAGTFRGQCAEFCGLQHAHMAFDVAVEPQDDFERWLDGLRAPAAAPQTEPQRRGHDVFMANRCSTCHTVAGTAAHGQIAPDLTHVASRRSIGAGTLPNTRDHLAAWVRDPQASKPGNQMPPNPLFDDDFQALVAYLESLR
jgi:cytochrome c oxidase subunit II